ncbi:MAG: hypothetical protein EPN48_00875 [Microbacteriaceae bacterium]|nr:MAG: hypothetical protein EPN48_00875 [Microbacteriaceae bacterium]
MRSGSGTQARAVIRPDTSQSPAREPVAPAPSPVPLQRFIACHQDGKQFIIHPRLIRADSAGSPLTSWCCGPGARPNTTLAAQAGIPIGTSGGIAVDQWLRTGIEGVWAAGDCAEKFHRVSRRPVVIALGTHANKEGHTAGINIGGGYSNFLGVIGTAVTKIREVEIGRTGLGEVEARTAEFDPLVVSVDSTARAGYHPGAKPIRTKLIAERGTGRLLGGRIVGEEGSAKRIDVLAMAVWNQITVQEPINVDVSYAPPFSPLWDPVLIAAP